MPVYVVYAQDYDGVDILSVWTDEAAAKAEAARLEADKSRWGYGGYGGLGYYASSAFTLDREVNHI
jgi:hypothetical protein